MKNIPPVVFEAHLHYGFENEISDVLRTFMLETKNIGFSIEESYSKIDSLYFINATIKRESSKKLTKLLDNFYEFLNANNEVLDIIKKASFNGVDIVITANLQHPFSIKLSRELAATLTHTETLLEIDIYNNIPSEPRALKRNEPIIWSEASIPIKYIPDRTLATIQNLNYFRCDDSVLLFSTAKRGIEYQQHNQLLLKMISQVCRVSQGTDFSLKDVEFKNCFLLSAAEITPAPIITPKLFSTLCNNTCSYQLKAYTDPPTFLYKSVSS